MNECANSELCPSPDQLRAWGSGGLASEQELAIESHIEHCPRCSTALDALDDDSDTFIQALSTIPCIPEDEAEFRRVRSELLSNPESVSEVDFVLDPAMPSPADREDPLPRRIAGYELLDRIGRGATGSVYRARHLKLDRIVAIKVLAKHRVGDRLSVSRFFTEMKAVGRLDHPNIIGATDAGEEEGRHYLVMEYVHGIDVSTLLSQLGSLDVADACSIVSRAARGLEYAAKHGMVHRDVKPSNLLFVYSGQVKVLDLGLVAIQEDPVSDGAEAAESKPCGTADYMSPEQWNDFASVDTRADIYSLGCTLFKLLAGRAPFHGWKIQYESARQAHLTGPVPSIRATRSEVPVTLDRILRRMMAKDPVDRYQRPADVIDALLPFTRNSDLAALGARFDTGAEQGTDTAAERGTDTAVPVSSNRRSRFYPNRRAFIGMAAAVSGVAASWSWFKHQAPSLRAGQWRDLQSIEPLISLAPLSQAHCEQVTHPNVIRVASTESTLFQLGQPVVGTFTIRTKIYQDEWQGGAGIFFKYRSRNMRGSAAHPFQAIQLSRRDHEGGPPTFKLVWRYSLYLENDGGMQETQEVWADTPVDVQPGKDGCELEVCLGRNGFPEVRWNGEALPASRWIVSWEARREANIARDKLQYAFLGRLGFINTQGETTFIQPQLMYLS